MSHDRARITRLVAEGLAIVLSILLAFAIDAWWDASQEQRRVDGVLITLEAGLAESISQLDERISVISRDAELVRRFMSSSPAGAVSIPFDSTRFILLGMWRPHTADNNLTFVEAAIGDEGLRALDDPELAAAVASWHVEVTELRELASQLASLEVEILTALGRHPEVAQMLLRAGEGDGVNAVTALVAAKTQRWRYQVRVMGRLREASQSILGLIRAE
jgi:hypothetical protein